MRSCNASAPCGTYWRFTSWPPWGRRVKYLAVTMLLKCLIKSSSFHLAFFLLPYIEQCIYQSICTAINDMHDNLAYERTITTYTKIRSRYNEAEYEEPECISTQLYSSWYSLQISMRVYARQNILLRWSQLEKWEFPYKYTEWLLLLGCVKGLCSAGRSFHAESDQTKWLRAST